MQAGFQFDIRGGEGGGGGGEVGGGGPLAESRLRPSCLTFSSIHIWRGRDRQKEIETEIDREKGREKVRTHIGKYESKATSVNA